MPKNQKESEESMKNEDSLTLEAPELCVYEALYYLDLDNQEPYLPVDPSPPAKKPSKTSKENESK